MNTDPSIVYFHTGAIPAYLRATLESARYFNPDARIFLLTDVAPSGLLGLRIEIRKLAELRSPKCDNFYRRYVHVSATKFDYERTCIGRWFYIAHLMQHEGCARGLSRQRRHVVPRYTPAVYVHACRPTPALQPR